MRKASVILTWASYVAACGTLVSYLRAQPVDARNFAFLFAILFFLSVLGPRRDGDGAPPS
jgi:hypothetical protein